MGTSIAVAAIAALGYIVSLFLHPYTKCETCNGSGKHSGAVFFYAMRQCHKCSGTTVKQRLGAQLLGIGVPRKSTGRRQPRTGR